MGNTNLGELRKVVYKSVQDEYYNFDENGNVFNSLKLLDVPQNADMDVIVTVKDITEDEPRISRKYYLEIRNSDLKEISNMMQDTIQNLDGSIKYYNCNIENIIKDGHIYTVTTNPNDPALNTIISSALSKAAGSDGNFYVLNLKETEDVEKVSYTSLYEGTNTSQKQRLLSDLLLQTSYLLYVNGKPLVSRTTDPYPFKNEYVDTFDTEYGFVYDKSKSTALEELDNKFSADLTSDDYSNRKTAINSYFSTKNGKRSIILVGFDKQSKIEININLLRLNSDLELGATRLNLDNLNTDVQYTFALRPGENVVLRSQKILNISNFGRRSGGIGDSDIIDTEIDSLKITRRIVYPDGSSFVSADETDIGKLSTQELYVYTKRPNEHVESGGIGKVIISAQDDLSGTQIGIVDDDRNKWAQPIIRFGTTQDTAATLNKDFDTDFAYGTISSNGVHFEEKYESENTSTLSSSELKINKDGGSVSLNKESINFLQSNGSSAELNISSGVKLSNSAGNIVLNYSGVSIKNSDETKAVVATFDSGLILKQGSEVLTINNGSLEATSDGKFEGNLSVNGQLSVNNRSTFNNTVDINTSSVNIGNADNAVTKITGCVDFHEKNSSTTWCQKNIGGDLVFKMV